MKKTSLILFAGFWMMALPVLLGAQDADEDDINDDLEQALALKYAPEWRFSKQTIYPNDDINLNSSNQNEDFDDTYPCAVDYLVYGNQAAGDGLPQLRFHSPDNGYPAYVYTDFTDINQISLTPVVNSGSLSGLEGDDLQCIQSTIEICLSYEDNLKGEPFSFPTYFNCHKTANQEYVAIMYFLFSAFDDKHETGSGFFGANHRGDWEYFIVFVNSNSVDFSSNN